MLNDPSTIVSFGIIIFFAIGLHEFAHCFFADLAGDPTPRYYGRVTLNLTKHFEPVGTMMMILSSIAGVGIGWGRPAPMNPDKMKNPRWDFFVAILAGPMSNILQAVIWALLAKVCILMGLITQSDLEQYNGPIATFFFLAVSINIGLALFNMIPLGPLDGHWLIGLLMPEQARLKWFLWNRKVGNTLLLVLIIGGQFVRQVDQRLDIWSYLMPVKSAATKLFLGIPSQHDEITNS